MSEQKKSNRFKALGGRLRASYEQEKSRDTRLHRASNKTRNFTQNSRARLRQYAATATKYQGKFDQLRKDPSKFSKSMTDQAKEAMGDRNPFSRKKGIRES
ncbi:MAG: hypothetical protein ABSE82_09910 [Nitrososphaerales archaeon]